MALIVSSLDKSKHDRNGFDCGEPALNDFLRTRAAKHQTLGVSRTFVLAEDLRPAHIIGFYTLSNCQIARSDISPEQARKLPHHPIPAILLARLGVSREEQKQGHGETLLMDAIRRCALVSQQTGVYALVVDAKHLQAKQFYEKFGFTEVSTNTMTLYLPMATAIQVL